MAASLQLLQLQRENDCLRQQLKELLAEKNAQDAPPPPSLPAAAATAAAQATTSGPGQIEQQVGADSTVHKFRAVHGLSQSQVERYSRQLLLPSFGITAQGKLCHSRVLIVGCGGLGSPAALYLAAAGVGQLGLVDHDVVELSNMHRQVIHSEERLGMHKAASAAAAVQALNSSVAVQLHLEGLNPSNAVDMVSAYDVVIDASDNPPTRYLINDACVACGVPLVSAAAVGTDGQLTVYNYGPDCPCYRCLFPECPAPANCSRCADAGVLGPVPGVMGVLQATEAIKVVTGVGEVLAGKLLLYDALAGRFTTIKLRGKAAACAACGPAAVISREGVASYDYRTFTGGQAANDGAPPPLSVIPSSQRLTATQLKQLLNEAAETASVGGAAAVAEAAEAWVGQTADAATKSQQQLQPLLLDVRPPEQFAIMSLPGAVNVPFLQLEQKLPEVVQLCCMPPQQQTAAGAGDSDAVSASQEQQQQQQRPVFVLCRRGNHSQLAVQSLRQAGVSQAVDVIGGYEAWAAQVDPGMPVL